VSPDATADDFDRRAPIVDGETFTLVAELEVRQAVRLRYYVSLVAIQADIEGPQLGIDWVALHHLIAEVIRGQVRGTDVVSVMQESPHLQVLLVNTHLFDLPTVIERIAAAVNRQAFEADGHTGRVTLSMGGATFPTTARARPELFRQAESLSVEARSEPGAPRHRYRLAQGTS
jgi:hypothetical protein